jgi:hypothetical protein
MNRHAPMLTHKKFVMVELGANGLPIRIFLSDKFAYRSGLNVGEMLRSTAVKLIRKQVFERSRGKCERCGAGITEKSGEMHEKNPRGMTEHVRGEYSVENSQFICRACHSKAHGNRNPQWTPKR